MGIKEIILALKGVSRKDILEEKLECIKLENQIKMEKKKWESNISDK